MKLIRQLQKIIKKIKIPSSSLQFQLTLELVILSVIGLGSVAFWAGWQMEQNLVAAHKQTLEYIAMRFPEQLEVYNEAESLETVIEKAISRVETSNLMVWVKNPQGQLLGQSSSLNNSLVEFQAVENTQQIPTKPQVVRFNGRDIVLCGTPLIVNGDMVGKLYLSQDITLDQQKLNFSLWRLFFISIVTVTVLVIAISYTISTGLKPLKKMSRVASTIKADDLSGAKLTLNQAPQEIIGLAQAFNEMLFRLSASWEQQRQFVGNVSHELRTPLTIVLGYLQSLLRRSDNLSTHQIQALETATAETERTIRMLEDLLDLARADSGNLHFHCQPLMLNTLVTEVAQMSQKVTDRTINLIITDEDVITCADQDRLQQVLINLVDNALKYSSPPQPIDIILEKCFPNALIHIRDYGIGISLAHQQRIFERFYRADDGMTRSRDGTGLGLALAKGMIEGMEGTIKVRSKPQEGSVFTISLPLWGE
ncbi:sensor histidine kinase [Cyanobacterium aponinum]|uniref:histidine kinase n=1 Tax=Cyanobacterium aponinum (strain PCC 10605) TaxID=755178 RepID=K9Z654_CYAAP|nr:HAMP domain-containing sensor histidine kinase [Cyanobacterium aponinum]AFZ54624.1 integral membrane sensor signal transduction histidine kinase [Cyanobacterium aponinum PCC 10605]